jgi:hypothetical protein
VKPARDGAPTPAAFAWTGTRRLRRALAERRPAPGCIHHSDRGWQPDASEYRWYASSTASAYSALISVQLCVVA